ncbi:MAG: hypothetical protein ACXABY_08640 [Candidatus Thorarchaeota archaeon]|jgi:hypothetical protein
MGKLTLGIATMEAGLGMPGSAFRELMEYCIGTVDKVIVVDGQPSWRAEQYYKRVTAFDLKVIYSPWTGSLKKQYDLMLDEMEDGDWWVMLDDDEIPSPKLCELLAAISNNLRNNAPGLWDIVPLGTGVSSQITILTPRVTYFTEDGKSFYPGEIFPTKEMPQGLGIAGPRHHIFSIVKDKLRMMNSPAGRHVVPFYPEGEQIFFPEMYHMHLKAPEQYVYNDCVKAMFDQDIKDPVAANEYALALSESGIHTEQEFLFKTATMDVSQSLLDFAVQYRRRGIPEGRVFMWLYNILHPELNPSPEQDWTASLKLLLNDNWRQTYVKNKEEGKHCYYTNKLTPYFMADGEIQV